MPPHPGLHHPLLPLHLLLQVLILLLFLLILWWLLRNGGFGQGNAREILNRRYASGELTKQQFERMKKDIEGPDGS